MVLDSVWTTGDLRYVASSLANGTEYDVQVRAVNSAGDGDWSVTLTGTPKQGDVPVTMGWEQTAVTVVEGAGTTTLRARRHDDTEHSPCNRFLLRLYRYHQRQQRNAAHRLRAIVRAGCLHSGRF